MHQFLDNELMGLKNMSSQQMDSQMSHTKNEENLSLSALCEKRVSENGFYDQSLYNENDRIT